MEEFGSIEDVKGPKIAQEPQPVDKSLFPDAKLGQFKIVKMSMRDATAKGQECYWTKNDWDLTTEEEQTVELPLSILKCGAVGREIVFYSEKPITNFEIVQKMSIHG